MRATSSPSKACPPRSPPQSRDKLWQMQMTGTGCRQSQDHLLHLPLQTQHPTTETFAPMQHCASEKASGGQTFVSNVQKCKHSESKTAQWNITKTVHLLSIRLQRENEKELLKHGGKVTPVPLDPPPKKQKRRRMAADQTGPKTSVYPFCSDKCVSTNLDNW